MEQKMPKERKKTVRIPGLDAGTTWVSDDFDDPLPDAFWLGDTANSESDTSEITQAFEQEVAAFEQMRPALLKQYVGQYVAVHQGKIVAVGDNKLAVLDEVRNRFGQLICYIEKVSPDSPRTVRMPSVRNVV